MFLLGSQSIVVGCVPTSWQQQPGQARGAFRAGASAGSASTSAGCGFVPGAWPVSITDRSGVVGSARAGSVRRTLTRTLTRTLARRLAARVMVTRTTRIPTFRRADQAARIRRRAARIASIRPRQFTVNAAATRAPTSTVAALPKSNPVLLMGPARQNDLAPSKSCGSLFTGLPTAGTSPPFCSPARPASESSVAA